MANELNKAIGGINSLRNELNGGTSTLDGGANRGSFEQDGFTVPNSPQADGNGLPFKKTSSDQTGRIRRNIITWFVPEFGAIKMFVNPNSIRYNYVKAVQSERTKGGYSLQYWGEELTTLTIGGTTGSSGIEGINVLEEIYRAEQYAFDGFGLSLAANNANATSGAAGIVDKVGGAIGGFFGGGSASSQAVGSGILGGILGTNTPNTNLATQNIPSLAQLAFSVEMYYDGIVRRGYFKSMSVTESATNFCWDYTMEFVVTQKRGYRTNYFPFHRSPNGGASEYSTPNSFSGAVKK